MKLSGCLGVLFAASVAVGGVACGVGERAGTLAEAVSATDGRSADARAVREAALASARVWHPPVLPIAVARFDVNPVGTDVDPDDEVECRFNPRNVGGTTPKF